MERSKSKSPSRRKKKSSETSSSQEEDLSPVGISVRPPSSLKIKDLAPTKYKTFPDEIIQITKEIEEIDLEDLPLTKKKSRKSIKQMEQKGEEKEQEGEREVKKEREEKEEPEEVQEKSAKYLEKFDWEDMPLIRRKPKKKAIPSPPKVGLERILSDTPDIITTEIYKKPITSTISSTIITQPPKDAIIPYQEPKSKKGISGTSKKPSKKLSPKPIEESRLTQEQCEMFIQASNSVDINQKFKNPITGKDMIKGSATYAKYLKDCRGKLTEQTSTQIRTEKEQKQGRYGIHRIYTCEDYPKAKEKPFAPNFHQIKAQNRFKQILEEPETKNQRGLLLYYGLGSGKTCTYAMIADTYRKIYPDRPVFIFTPGSLRTNFLEQYCSFCGLNPRDVSKHFIFYTLNDTTIMKKLPKNFNDSLVIIDEVHKLTHGKTNDSGVLSFIYDAINNSKNMSLVSGSGTPIETNIEELYYLTNLHLENQFPMLNDFKNIFEVQRDPENKKEYVYFPKNRNQFEKIFSSYISYYNPEKQLEDSGANGFPKVFYEKVRVPINPEREEKLVQVVSDETERMKPPNENLKFTDPEKYKKQKSYYYTAVSRLVSSQLSNYKYPLVDVKDLKDAVRVPLSKKQKEEQGDLPLETEEGAEMSLDEINDEIGKEIAEKNTAVGMRIMDLPKEDGGWITEEQVENLYDDGEKIDQILQDIMTQEGKHAVYTRFKTYYGSRLLGALLDIKGIPYVFFDGDMNDDDRIKVLEQFNSPANINGDKIKVIILTSAGSAGINLKEIRRFHILEQYFNLSYMKQVIGRGVRYLSHERLPQHKRNITIRNYFLELSDPKKTELFSPDVLLAQTAKSKDMKIAKVREIIQSFGI